MKQLLGKKIINFRSFRIYVNLDSSSDIEVVLDYNSILLVNGSKGHHTPIHINSYWVELENRHDDFGLSISIDEEFKVGIYPRYPHMKSSFSKNYSTPFIVSKIEIYGYKREFNIIKPTQHIALLYSKNSDDKILMRPGGSGIGLFLTFERKEIDNFFKNDINHELIYLTKTYANDKV